LTPRKRSNFSQTFGAQGFCDGRLIDHGAVREAEEPAGLGLVRVQLQLGARARDLGGKFNKSNLNFACNHETF
jgi:hypothetical protein